MHNSRFTKALEEVRAVKMTSSEKAALQARILQKIQSSQVGGAELPATVPSPWSFYSFTEWFGQHRLASSVMAALLIVVLGGGGLAYAAEGALPGDALYPAKIALIEPIRGAFFVSPNARARFEAELVATRLAEADELAQKGDTDPAKQEEIRVLVAEHTEAFNEARKSAKSSSLADAQVSIDAGARFIASSDTKPAIAAMSASLAADATATSNANVRAMSAPGLMKESAEIKSANGIHTMSGVSATPATSSNADLPHLPDIKDVKNAIQETGAVVNSVTKVETVVAATNTPAVPVKKSPNTSIQQSF